MQGASAYMPALANGNIQVLYGGGTAVSRAIATRDFDVMVIATETRYVPLRLMVNASIRTPADLKGKRSAPASPASTSTRRCFIWKNSACRGKDVRWSISPAGFPAGWRR